MIKGGIRAMMMGLLVAVSIAAGGLHAEPAQETVQVEGDALTGLWTLSAPESASVSLLGKVTFGPMQDHLCRMERAPKGFSAHCLGWDFHNFHVDGQLDGSKVHLAGGMMLLRIVVDGDLQSSTGFTGTMGAKVFGIRVDNPEPMKASKLTVAAATPDAAGFGKALAASLNAIADAPDGAPRSLAATKRGHRNRESLTPELLRSLGPVQTVLYLADVPRGARKGEGQDVSIYAVEFAHGERLCAVDKEHGIDSGIVCA